MQNHATPIIAIVLLLLLPALYVGTYLALVKPPFGEMRVVSLKQWKAGGIHYRFGGRMADRFFWPLGFCDRRLRPDAWNSGYNPGAPTESIPVFNP